MVNNQGKMKKHTTISITQQTKGSLDQVKHTGQSYDGLIQDLIGFWKRGHEIEETDQGALAVERGR